ncbi:MAG: hypothetical protein D6763_00310 [Alphaproteobacteria bacterium]|nr:MAG: hypothetical protein D6763_00310 [Alphaproteobacteria bacterium]
MVLGILPAFFAGLFAVAQAAMVIEETPLPPKVAAFLSATKEHPPVDEALERIRKNVVPALRQLAANRDLIKALRAHNAARMTLTAAEIRGLERDWRNAVATRDWRRLEAILGTPASEALRTALEQDGLASARLYLSDNRNLLTAATTPVGTFELGDWGGWRRIYMSSPETAFIETTDQADGYGFYRVEIGVWDPEQGEAIGTLIAEIPWEAASQPRRNEATSSTSADHRN